MSMDEFYKLVNRRLITLKLKLTSEIGLPFLEYQNTSFEKHENVSYICNQEMSSICKNERRSNETENA